MTTSNSSTPAPTGKTPDELAALASSYLQQNRPVDLVTLLSETVKDNPNDIGALMLLNLIYHCAASARPLPARVMLPQLGRFSAADLLAKHVGSISAEPAPRKIGEIECDNPAMLYTIRNALLLPPHAALLVGDDLVTDSIPIAPHCDISFKLALESFSPLLLENPAPTLAGEYVPLCSLWSGNFFHWVMDYLPRLLLAEAVGFKGRYLVRPNPRFIRESLALLGISGDRILELEPSVPVRVESLLLSSPFPACTFFDHSWPLKLLREKMLANSQLEAAPAEGSRILLARRGPARTIDNQEELERLLSKFNFRTVYTEEMALKDQISLFRSCTALVAPHGAGLVHTVWMPPRSLVLEMFPPRYVNPCLMGAARMLKHRYYMVPTYQNNPDAPENAPVTAFCQALELILERELG